MISVIGQFFKNIASTYLSVVVGLAITFFFTPYLISMLDKERYGIWQLAFSILAYLGLVDLGMKQSIVRYYSKFYAVKDWPQLNEVYSSAVRVYAAIGSVIVLVTLGLAYGLLDRFQIPTEFADVARITILILGVDQAVTYIFVPHTAVGGFHRFDVSNYFRLSKQIIQTLVMVYLLEMGFGLVAMAVVVICLDVIFLILVNLYRSRSFPEMAFSRNSITKEKTRLLFSYGIYSFLIVVTWIIVFQTGNLVVGWFISMEAVALYSVAASIVTQIRGAVNVIAIPLVPTISHLDAEGNFEKIQQIYSKASGYLYFLSSWVAIGTFMLGGPFVLLWLGPDFLPSVEILQILIGAAAVFFPQMIANSILLGISKHKIAFYVLAAEAVGNIILSVVLVKPFGLVGVAYGTAIPQVIVYGLVYPYVFHKVIGGDVKQFYIRAAKSIALGLVSMLPVAYVISTLVTPDSWLNLIFDGLVLTAAMMLGGFKFVLEPADRRRITDKINESLVKIKLK